MKQKKPVKAHVTTIQEYSQLVISCMQRGRRMNTTEVAKSILPFVSPKTTKLVPTWRMRLGVDRKCASSRRGRAQCAEGNPPRGEGRRFLRVGGVECGQMQLYARRTRVMSSSKGRSERAGNDCASEEEDPRESDSEGLGWRTE